MIYVLDTSVLIDSLRGGIVLGKFVSHVRVDDKLTLPSVVVLELYSGTSTLNSKVARKIEVLISKFQIINMDEMISKRSGIMIRDLGRVLEMPDFITAATALELGGQVVTLNKKHFSKIPGIVIFPI